MEIHRSARRHRVSDDDINHVLRNAIGFFDLEPDADPPKGLAIGPARDGRLTEIVWLELSGGMLVIHAMPLRPAFYDLLRNPGMEP